MAYGQGDIVVVPDPFSAGARPVLIVSNDDRPYHGDQYTIAVITTTPRDVAIEITAGDFEQGKLNKLPSYVNPWSLHEFNHDDIHKRVAVLSATKRSRVATECSRYLETQ